MTTSEIGDPALPGWQTCMGISESQNLEQIAVETWRLGPTKGAFFWDMHPEVL